MSFQNGLKSFEKIDSNPNMLSISFIDILKPNIKVKQNDNVITMLDIVKDEPEAYLELLSVAIFHRNLEITKLIIDKYINSEIDPPSINALSFYNSILKDNSNNIIQDSKDNYIDIICPFVLMAGIGGDIQIFEYLMKNGLIPELNLSGVIGLTKKYKNIINSNIIGACAYYGNDKLLEYLLKNYRSELDINFITTENKSKTSKMRFSKELSETSTPLLACVGPSSDEKTIEILKILEEYKANFEKRDFNENNIIHIATRRKKIKTLKFLINSMGLQDIMNESNNDNLTPLDIAQQMKNDEIVSFFKKYGKADENEMEEDEEEQISYSTFNNNNNKKNRQNTKNNNNYNFNEDKKENKDNIKDNQNNEEHNIEETKEKEDENNNIIKYKKENKNHIYQKENYKKQKYINRNNSNYKKINSNKFNDNYNKNNKYNKSNYESYNNHDKYNNFKNNYNNNYNYNYYNNINIYNKKNSNNIYKTSNQKEYYNSNNTLNYYNSRNNNYNKNYYENNNNNQKNKSVAIEVKENISKDIPQEDQEKKEKKIIIINKNNENQNNEKTNNIKQNKKEDKKEELEEEDEGSYSDENFLSEKEDSTHKNQYNELYKKYLDIEMKCNNLEKEKKAINKYINKIYMNKKSYTKNIPNNKENINALLNITNEELKNKDTIIKKLKKDCIMVDLSNINNLTNEKLKEYKNFYIKKLKIINEALKG